ncbi:hypothetical protein CALVIDRAFT_225774 [Calocera viscosa TUFC12733]|uniref:Aminoglycoside phosphotransferase domain-containing protein n=1 Tax=Calocera viscosa (strain TUFC12733) TaxID=1330018 RepID=A0A167K1L6_CALVF|nr:hypothetical protein CALVIDRAFT_225774 [Calocera viscosa TUFC12733]
MFSIPRDAESPISTRRLSEHLPLLGKIWLALPLRFRAFAYSFAWNIASTIFPAATELGCHHVRRVWPGIVFKRSVWPKDLPLAEPVSSFTQRTEAEALWLVRHYTAVPCPTLFDYVIYPLPRGNVSLIIMSEMPGTIFREAAETMTDAQVNQVGEDLRTALEAIRRIPNTTDFGICSASGERIRAPYFYDSPIEPLKDVAAFQAHLRKQASRFWPVMGTTLEPILSNFDPNAVFTHGDVTDHNIMVHQGRLSGLIDWGTAGWMPVYWEYACSVNLGNGSLVFMRMLKVAMPIQYEMQWRAVTLDIHGKFLEHRL